MAITKIHPIQNSVKGAVEYIVNPNKTKGKTLVSSFGCSAETAPLEFEWTKKSAHKTGGVLAHHLIQSFSPGEVDFETAHEIGKQLANKLLGGKHEYVLSTHTDKNHVHNHIIFNSVSFVTHEKYRSPPNSYYRIRRISDTLCAEHGLTVIEAGKSKGKSYYEYTVDKQGGSYKSKLREAIDRSILKASDWDEFLSLMKSDRYEIKQGKHISFRNRNSDQERFTRAKTLGEEYTEERIKERINGVTKASSKIKSNNGGKKISLMIDIENSIKAKQSKGFEYWAKLENLKTAAKTLNFLTGRGIDSYEGLTAEYEEIRNKKDSVQEQIKAAEKRIKEIDETIHSIDVYRKTKPVVDKLDSAVFKDRYRKENEADFILFNAAEQSLKTRFPDGKLPFIKTLRAEQSKLYADKGRLYSERNRSREEYREIQTMKKNIDLILGNPAEHEKEKSRTVGKGID